MSVRHSQRNRLVPPDDFVELHDRAAVSARRPAVAAGGPCDNGNSAGAPSISPTPPSPNASEGLDEHPMLGGLGVVSMPPGAYETGSLPVSRRRNVFHVSVAARIRAYYEAMPEASMTRRLVPPSVGQRTSQFDKPVLRAALKLALSSGGGGMSQMDQKTYLSVLLLAEEGGRSCSRGGRRGAPRPRRAERLSTAIGGTGASRQHAGTREPVGGVGDSDGDSSDDDTGDIARAFPTKHSFVAAVREEQRRVLSKLCWDETPL